MENKNEANLSKVPEGMSLFDAMKIACLALGTPVNEEEDNGRKHMELFDSWEILRIIEDAGHGAEIVTSHDGIKPVTFHYNESCSFDKLETLSERLFKSIKEGCTVTVNGTNVLDIFTPNIPCDHIWDILHEAGHGAEVIIHKDKPETLYYNDFATQSDNVRFMSHIWDELEKRNLVTVNGTDIFDLY